MRAFRAISPVYTWVFVLVRSCVGPPAIAWLSRRLVSEADQVPAGVRCASCCLQPRNSDSAYMWKRERERGELTIVEHVFCLLRVD